MDVSISQENDESWSFFGLEGGRKGVKFRIRDSLLPYMSNSYPDAPRTDKGKTKWSHLFYTSFFPKKKRESNRDFFFAAIYFWLTWTWKELALLLSQSHSLYYRLRRRLRCVRVELTSSLEFHPSPLIDFSLVTDQSNLCSLGTLGIFHDLEDSCLQFLVTLFVSEWELIPKYIETKQEFRTCSAFFSAIFLPLEWHFNLLLPLPWRSHPAVPWWPLL